MLARCPIPGRVPLGPVSWDLRPKPQSVWMLAFHPGVSRTSVIPKWAESPDSGFWGKNKAGECLRQELETWLG